MTSQESWIEQEARTWCNSAWCDSSPEFHALMADLSDDLDHALHRLAVPRTESELIQAGVDFVMGGKRL